MKGAAIRRILELIAELASVLARIDPFLLAKNGPHSKHDFASEATVRACFVEGLGARQRCWREPNALAFGSQLPTQLPRMALSRVAESDERSELALDWAIRGGYHWSIFREQTRVNSR